MELLFVVAGHGAEQESGIFHRLGDGAGLVERGGEATMPQREQRP